jgi:EAL domain-containing protein (putative c-di-GMP-specific phosphodiesterase class I)
VVVVAERVQSAFVEPFRVGGSEQQMTGSLGVMLSRGEGSASELLRDADVAMYRAKATQKGSFEFFDAAFRAALLRKVAVGRALKKALRDRTPEVYYQPIVSLVDSQMLAVEALVRWRDPQWGWVQPSEFIPIAEEDGTIVRLGRYVMGEAARAVAEWRRQSPAGLPLGVHINVSARELVDPDFADHVTATLAEHGLTSSDVAFEITERVFVNERQLTVSHNLEELGRLGIRLILDDFGTGYSALGYLARFPLSALKIDRFFIRSIRDPADESPITKAVISLGEALGMTVIAEGIEQQVQLDYLRRLGCDLGQGFHFARPLPAAGILAHLRGARPLGVSSTQVAVSTRG